jgi:hypothetical protein
VLMCETRAILTCGLVTQRYLIPSSDIRRLAARDMGLHCGIRRLQGSIAAAVIAVQVRIHNQI